MKMRIISMLLCVVMIFAVCPGMPIKAAEADVQVILDLDFENLEVGVKPKFGTTFFDAGPLNDIARIYPELDTDGNKVLKVQHGAPEEGKSRSPRLTKNFASNGLTNLTVSYRVKSSGGASAVTLCFMEAGTSKVIAATGAPSDFKAWTDIRIEINLKKNTAQVYVNGKKSGAAVDVNLSDYEKFAMALCGTCGADGSWAMVDDFKVTTTDIMYKIAQEAELTTPYNEADAKPESGNLIAIMDEDFETHTVGRKPDMGTGKGFTSGVSKDVARMYVEADTDGNKVLRAYHGAPNAPGEAARSPRMERLIPIGKLNILTLDMDVKSSGGATKFPTVYLIHESENSPIYTALSPSSPKTDWVHVKIRFDLKNGVSKAYVDGRLHSEAKIDLQGAENANLRIGCTVELDGSWVAIDNVLLTTSDVATEELIGIDGVTVNWDKMTVSAEENTGMGNVLRQAHPRIYVTDWQEIRNKIATDENAAAWYRTVLADAQAQLTKGLVEYKRHTEKNNLNAPTTEFKNRVVPLALAYCVSGDVRYKDRLYQEIENAGNWKDWGADAWLCTAHMNFAYAVCYDWLYNDWTEEERENILNWFKEKGLREAVLAYEGYGPSVSWVHGTNNWNYVCNGSNIVAALAVYNEMPVAAEYILRHAAEGLPYGFQEISADGAFSEPINYWDYAIRHLVKVMAAVDSSVADGKTVPAVLDFKDVRGLDKTCDYPIYNNGATAAFNYGDGVDTFVVSPLMYYIADKYNKPEYAWYSINLRDTNSFVEPLVAKDAALSILWYNPEKMATGDLPLDKFYSSHEKYGANSISMRSSFAHTDALVVMVHAGDQTASHSNLDAGGFVLDWAGKRWVHMYGKYPVANVPGGGVYAWPNFSAREETSGHYDYYHCRAEANNTIIANPRPYKPDMYYQYFAQVERYASGANKAFGIVDMTDTNPDYEKAKRGIMLTANRDVLVVQDEITAKKPSEFYWFVNTRAEVTLAPDGKSALWEMDGDKMLVRITQGPADAKLELVPAQPLPTSPDPEIQPDIPEHKMRIHVTNQESLKLTVEFVPLAEGEGIPVPQPIVALDDWSADGSAPKTTSQSINEVLALKVDNPNAFAKGKKTYVDTANLDIKPIVQNGRTLVPVRFISENIGATVGWDDATQTVSVKTKAKDISLQIGSATMLVNGAATTLDVPAQTIGGRTLIPLRALVEALGKQVFWDDRGLILITDAPVTYDAAKIDAIIDLLDIRVQSDGKEIKFFDSEVYNYNVEIAKGAPIPTLSVISDKEAAVLQGNPATVTVGGKNYTFHFVENPFDGVSGTGTEGVAKTLSVTVKNAGTLPNYQTYIDIASATSSIEFSEEKYPENGSYDGIISEETFNRWSAQGSGNWICYDFGKVTKLHSVAIAGYLAISRNYKYDIEASSDGVHFTKICEAATEPGANRSVFKLGDIEARYVRVTGTYTSNSGAWLGISEIRFYDNAQMEADDQSAWNHYFHTSSIYARAGEKLQLEVEGKSKSGQAVPIAIADVTLTSENPEIATVSPDGVVTLVKAGSTNIVAETTTVLGNRIRTSLPVTVE